LERCDAPSIEDLDRMLAMIPHRGPDQCGVFRDSATALGSARLSIIDLGGGQQPVVNEDGTLWAVFNGEVFNHVELRAKLVSRGHRFSTRTDTEVVVHLYEEYGAGCVDHLNGQFALALWDSRDHTLLLARDRVGVAPLFYTVHQGRFIFGSEIKSILAYPGVRAEIDPASLEQVFTFWSTLAPRTIFCGIDEVPPAHCLSIKNGVITRRRYWALDFTEHPDCCPTERDAIEHLDALLEDAVRLRLRADVPVGAYLSGGLDSSMTAAIARKHAPGGLETFSVAFANPGFDESAHQRFVADFLGTRHHVVHCTDADISRVFPDVVWHTEAPVLRTAPAPMLLLSKLVRERGLKVVLTGEGADEFLGGYDIFKEMKVRRFWAKAPDSRRRPLLLRRLYRDIGALGDTTSAYLSAFFRRGLAHTDSPFYSHALRWNNATRLHRFLSRPRDRTPDSLAEAIPLPLEFARWSHLGQAQYLEAVIFLSGYLLSSQGDRMAMAHSVEGRHPFLDHRVIEFVNRIPPTLKLRGLTEKWVLKQVARRWLPAETRRRTKRPYRAPVWRTFFAGKLEYVEALLSEAAIADTELFNAAAVQQLKRKAADGVALSETEEMALTGVLSTQLVHHHFIRTFASRRRAAPQALAIEAGSIGGRRADRVRVVDHVSAAAVS
jgi:asparagine synthase (glutamine-hydrolysing)